MSCHTTLVSLRNSSCGIDVQEGLWLGDCVAFIFSEVCRTVGSHWFSGPLAAWKNTRYPIASLAIQTSCYHGPSVCAEKSSRVSLYLIFCQLFIIHSAPSELWILNSTLHRLNFYFSFSLFLFCNQTPLAISILKHARSDKTWLALKIHISRKSMIPIPVKFQFNKKRGRGWTFSDTPLYRVEELKTFIRPQGGAVDPYRSW